MFTKDEFRLIKLCIDLVGDSGAILRPVIKTKLEELNQKVLNIAHCNITGHSYKECIFIECRENGQCAYKDNPVPSLDEWKKFIDNKYGRTDWSDLRGNLNPNLFIGIYHLFNEFLNQNGRETDKEQPMKDCLKNMYGCDSYRNDNVCRCK